MKTILLLFFISSICPLTSAQMISVLWVPDPMIEYTINESIICDSIERYTTKLEFKILRIEDDIVVEGELEITYHSITGPSVNQSIGTFFKKYSLYEIIPNYKKDMNISINNNRGSFSLPPCWKCFGARKKSGSGIIDYALVYSSETPLHICSVRPIECAVYFNEVIIEYNTP
jgi:hypothetical protein